MRTSTISLRARLARTAFALALAGTIVGGATVSPAFAGGGRRGPHDAGYAPATSGPYYKGNGRTVLSRKAGRGAVVVPGAAYSRPRRARAYNPSVYGPGPYNTAGGYYDPYNSPYPNYYPNPAYTYDPDFGRRSDKGRDAVTIVAGTAGGAVLGAMLGGKKGAIMGGVIGAAASTVIATKTKGERRFPF
jgi:hypothetical protein